MAEEERGIVGREPGVDHDLGDVDGPTFREHAAAEDGPRQRRRPVRVDTLEVVARHRLVDGEEPEHPVVVLAEIALGLLGRPVVGDRGDREERLLALVERSRRVEHRPAERPQEDRRPADLERLVGQPDEVVLAAERLDPAELGAAEVEGLLGRRMLDRDGVEDALDDRRVIARNGQIRAPHRPDLASDPDHLGADRRKSHSPAA